jgi:hypothetical protein
MAQVEVSEDSILASSSTNAAHKNALFGLRVVSDQAGPSALPHFNVPYLINTSQFASYKNSPWNIFDIDGFVGILSVK